MTKIDLLSSQALVICSRNRFARLESLIRNLSDCTALPEIVVIVDSSDDVVELATLKGWQEKLTNHLYYVHSRPGLPHQRNVALDVILRSSFVDKIEICNFLDDDVQIPPSYFNKVAAIFEEFKPAILGAFDINLPDPATGVMRRWFGLSSRESGRLLKSGIAIAPANIKQLSDADWVAGHSAAFSWRLISVQGFDQNIRMYGEDVEVCRRLSKLGRIIVHPQVFASHKPDPSQRDSAINAQAYSSGFRWRLAVSNSDEVKKSLVLMSTMALLLGGLAQIAWRRDYAPVMLGQLKFLGRLLTGREVEQKIFRPSLSSLKSGEPPASEELGKVKIYSLGGLY